jgi:hypothetical protein
MYKYIQLTFLETWYCHKTSLLIINKYKKVLFHLKKIIALFSVIKFEVNSFYTFRQNETFVLSDKINLSHRLTNTDTYERVMTILLLFSLNSGAKIKIMKQILRDIITLFSSFFWMSNAVVTLNSVFVLFFFLITFQWNIMIQQIYSLHNTLKYLAWPYFCNIYSTFNLMS